MSDSLELEIRFIYEDDVESKLESIGAKLKENVLIIDSYYDNEKTCFLTLNDYWLRFREENSHKGWQLKYPIERNKSYDSNSIQKYYEINEERRICEAINKLYNDTGKGDQNFTELDHLMKALNYTKFAPISTQRLVYVYENFEIDLDKADFGYKVGEIEYKDTDRMNLTLEEKAQQINNFSKKLGVSSVKKVPAKMEIYLYKFRPAHFRLLFGNNYDLKEYFSENI